MLLLLMGTHLFLTFRLKFIQKYLFKAIKLSVTKDDSGSGDISQFGALTTALAATIGTGNIVGVATAIALGGPGAVFWTWMTGVFGIATKYSEGLLAVKYRVKSINVNYFRASSKSAIKSSISSTPNETLTSFGVIPSFNLTSYVRY